MEVTTDPTLEETSVDQTDVFDGWDTGEVLDTQADQPEQEAPAQTAEEAPGDPAPEEKDPAAEASPQEEPPFLTLKHLDEVRTVNREEAQALAQKGLDYDRIREERDSLRSFREENGPAIELVQKFAQRNNMTISEYLEFCRVQEVMSEQHVTEEVAKNQVALEKRELDLSRREEAQAEKERRESEAQQQEETQQERIRREVNQFLADYPEVKPAEIPKEVFEMVQRDKTSLSLAYGKWLIAKQAQELNTLKAQASAREKSPGSLSGSLGSAKTDPAFDGWD